MTSKHHSYQFGHAVTFTATVGLTPQGAGTATGLVAFTVDGTSVGSVNLNGAGQAQITTSSLAPGNHTIGAIYPGSALYTPSGATVEYLVTCTNSVTGSHPGALTASGDSMCIVNATIGGGIVVLRGTSLAVKNSTIQGSINATNQPQAIQLCGSTVSGSLSVIGAHEFIGGRPATLDELRDRYHHFVAGPTEPGEIWLNWIVRQKLDQVAIGTMQTTISTSAAGRLSADMAWITGSRWQGQGFATESARSIIDWLHSHRIDDITARIHPTITRRSRSPSGSGSTQPTNNTTAVERHVV